MVILKNNKGVVLLLDSKNKKPRLLIISLLTFCVMLCMSLSAFASGFAVKQGMRGDHVKKVQTFLIDQGYLKDTADGICGPKTVSAIKRFQEMNKLKVDGVCGPETYKQLSGGQDPPAMPVAPTHGQIITVEATAYSAQDPGNSAHTASGTPVRHGVIAVDPSFIPIGTHVYIPNYGEAVAEDIGWGVQGNTIDVAFDTHEEALAFGRQVLEIYVLN